MHLANLPNGGSESICGSAFILRIVYTENISSALSLPCPATKICRGVSSILLPIFYSLQEAQIVIEKWRVQYNTLRPHSALGYRPPAPAAGNPYPPPRTVPQPRAVM